MAGEVRAAASFRNGSRDLEAFRGLVLEDQSLQQHLRQAGRSDETTFVADLLETAHKRGFAFSGEDVRQAMREHALGIQGFAGADTKATPAPPDGWLPIRASWQAGELYAHWAYFGERRLTEPFFEGDVRISLYQPFNRLFGYVTPIEELGEWLKTRPRLQPSGLIFHMSRCGSTLVSQMLAALPSNIVISEASPIDTVAQARHRRPDLDEDREARWLASIVGALGQKRRGGEQTYFIKLDCWHTLALPLFRRVFPAVPWVFLYRDPVEVLVSQLRMPGTQMLPHGIGPDLYGIERSYGPGGAEDYYARVLAKVCEPVVRHYSEGGGLLVNYRQLPDALFTAILPHFRVAFSDADRAAMSDAACFDAKTRALEFVPDGHAKQNAATQATRAAADRWLADLYRRLEALRRTADDAVAGKAASDAIA